MVRGRRELLVGIMWRQKSHPGFLISLERAIFCFMDNSAFSPSATQSTSPEDASEPSGLPWHLDYSRVKYPSHWRVVRGISGNAHQHCTNKKYLNTPAFPRMSFLVHVLFYSSPTGIQQIIPIFLAVNVTSLSLHWGLRQFPSPACSCTNPQHCHQNQLHPAHLSSKTLQPTRSMSKLEVKSNTIYPKRRWK